MKCPECGGELIEEGEDYKGPPGTDKTIRIVYKCDNADFGFDTEDAARAYAEQKYSEGGDPVPDDWRAIICGSTVDNGYFYSVPNGDLVQGYPC